MTDRIVRALTLRPCTYRSPDGAWHRDYPGDWKGPMKRDHFEQIAGRGEAVQDPAEGLADEGLSQEGGAE